MPPGGQVPDFDTIILAGGGGVRMDGADKPALEVGGLPLLVCVARAAAAAGSGRVIVVGPRRAGAVASGLAAVAAGLERGLATVRESPPGRGPVPALRRGITEADAPWLAVLAADLPFLTGAWLAEVLSHAAACDRAGAVPADAGGRPQWLASCWRTDVLTAALNRYHGGSLGGLMRPLEPMLIEPAAGVARSSRPPWLDCDDPAQLASARAAYLDGDA
jgi:molybdopterin-guanine dinucleotide biosynthesis protein A